MRNKIAGLILTLILAHAVPLLATEEVAKYEMKIVYLGDVPGTGSVYVIGQAGFKTVEALKKHIAGLPKGSIISWAPGCVIMEDDPLLGKPSALEEFRSYCKNNGIQLDIAPSG